jgi:hypothetical protein
MSDGDKPQHAGKRNPRGVYQRHHAACLRERTCDCPWWIRYFDEYGRKHRENIGPKGLAVMSTASARRRSPNSGSFPTASAAATCS